MPVAAPAQGKRHMPRRVRLIAAAIFAIATMASGGAQAQTGWGIAAAPAQRPGTIQLREGDASPGTATEEWIQFGEQRIVHNVSVPTLEPVLPRPGTATGAAIIIAPGGGFLFESMENEGYRVANWLAAHGVSAFVLKYRLAPTPSGVEPFGRMLGAEVARWRASKLDMTSFTPKLALAVEDAQAAMRVVRARSKQWGVDPSKVGFMGFSAGAMTTLGLVAADAPGTAPDFVIPIYGPMATPPAPLPDKLPPMFTALAANDELFGKSDLGLIQAWQGKAPVELHLYETGGHGFGFSGAQGTTAANWTSALLSWLQTRGLAKP